MVLKDMIFPLAEKLGQTIIFVRTRDTARRLHQHVSVASIGFCFVTIVSIGIEAVCTLLGNRCAPVRL